MTRLYKTRPYPIKALCSLLAALICVALCSGCSVGRVIVFEEERSAAERITFFGNKYEAENVAVIEEILAGFMKENTGLEVTYESLKGAQYYDALNKRALHDKADDVFMVDHDAALRLRKEGVLADLTKIAGSADYNAQMIEQMTDDDGIVRWLPTTVSAFGLYCNVDLLKSRGLSAPRDLGEWRAACEIFAADGVTPIVANNDISIKTLAIGIGFGDVYESGRQREVFGRLNAGEEELSGYLRSGFALAAEFCEKGYIDAELALNTQKTSDDLTQFAAGKAPFMLTGAWAAKRVKAIAPALGFTIVPLPVKANGGVLVVNPDTRIAVNARSPKAAAAEKFVEFFIRQDNIEKFTDEQSSFSPLRGGRHGSVGEIKPLTEYYNAGKTLVIGADEKLNFGIWDITAAAAKKLLGGAGLDAVMKDMDAQVAEELAA